MILVITKRRWSIMQHKIIKNGSGPLFKPEKNDFQKIQEFAACGNHDEVEKMLKINAFNKTKKLHLLNLAGKTYAENGYRKEALEIIEKGGDSAFVAAGFTPKDLMGLKIQLSKLSSNKQHELLNNIVFEWAKKKLVNDVNYLLDNFASVTKQRAILGYAHGGHTDEANALCKTLAKVTEERKVLLAKAMAFGYALTQQFEALEKHLLEPPFQFENPSRDKLIEGALDGFASTNISIEKSIAKINNKELKGLMEKAHHSHQVKTSGKRL